MNGLRTARAVIIDDEILHAMPMIQALGAIGIGSVYFDGEAGTVYENKLGGVRLLLLDVVLANRGAIDGDDANTVSILIGAIEQVLDPGPGYALIVCWTRQDEIKDLIKAAFSKAFPDIHLIGILHFRKQDYINLETGNLIEGKFAELMENVQRAIEGNEPSALLSGWEQLVHEAAAKTAGGVFRAARSFAAPEADGLAEGAYAVCAALAIAERGNRVAGENPLSAIKGLTNALGPLLLDRIEHFKEADVGISHAAKEKLLEYVKIEVGNGRRLTDKTRAILNTSLNITREVVASDVCPGTLYLMVNNGQNREKAKSILSEDVWNELVGDTFRIASEALPLDHYPILLEISPACDFAQDKGKIPRFIAGFLVPLITELIVPKTDFLRNVSFFQLDEFANITNGMYHLVLNAHFNVSLTFGIAKELTPTARLRSAITLDLVSWLAGHMSRPGFVQLTPIPAFKKPPKLATLPIKGSPGPREDRPLRPSSFHASNPVLVTAVKFSGRAKSRAAAASEAMAAPLASESPDKPEAPTDEPSVPNILPVLVREAVDGEPV